MGLTETGFTRPTYNDILQNKINKAKELFGEDIDTSEFSLFGKFIRIDAYDLAKAYEDLELIYYARFPNTARGVSLDRLCTFVGISRNPATAAIHEVTIKGTPNYVVPIDFIVSTENEINFYTISETTISSDGQAVLTVACDTIGLVGNVNNNDITKIVNPDTNVTEIISSERITDGESEESDTELRKRFKLAAQGGGSCNANSVISNVLRVPTVVSVNLIEDLDNHTFSTYVYGGDNYDDEIAKAIFEKAPVGIKTLGDITKTVKDISGFSHTIKFSHTTPVTIYVKFTIVKNDNFPSDGNTQIKNNIVDYINNLGVGADVITTSIYPKIYSVTGVQNVTDLQLSINGTTWSASDISISDNQVANIIDSRITIS